MRWRGRKPRPGWRRGEAEGWCRSIGRGNGEEEARPKERKGAGGEPRLGLVRGGRREERAHPNYKGQKNFKDFAKLPLLLQGLKWILE